MQSTLSIVESGIKIPTMNEMQRFGKLIEDAMRKRGIVGYQLASMLGKQQSWVSRLVNGQNSNPPDPYDFDQLSRTLGVSKRSMLEAIGYLDPEVPDAGVAYVIHEGDPRVAILDLLAEETDEGIGTVAQIVGLLNLHSRAGAGVEESSKPNRDQSNTG